VQILRGLKVLVFIHICKCGFYDGYARQEADRRWLKIESEKLRKEGELRVVSARGFLRDEDNTRGEDKFVRTRVILAQIADATAFIFLKINFCVSIRRRKNRRQGTGRRYQRRAGVGCERSMREHGQECLCQGGLVGAEGLQGCVG
jgi:hypothetical protein